MGPLALAGIGAGAGLLKHFLWDKGAEDRQRQLASATQRYSPWTGLTAEAPKESDPFGNAMAFGATGAQVGMGMEKAESDNEMRDAYRRNLDAQTQALNYGQTSTPSLQPSVATPAVFHNSAPARSPYDNFWGEYANSYDNNMVPMYDSRRMGA